MSTENLKNKRKKLFFFLRLAVALLAILLIFQFGDWNITDIYTALGQLDPLAFCAAIALFILGNVIVSIRWYILLRTQTTEIPYFTCLKLHFLGLFYTNLLMGSVTGDLFRMWYITHHTTRRLESVFSVVMDRLMGLMSLILLVTIVYVLIPLEDTRGGISISTDPRLGQWITTHWEFMAGGLAVFITISGLLMLIPGYRNLVIKRIHPFISRWNRLIRALMIYGSRPGILIIALLLTLVAQSLPILGYWLIGYSSQINAPMKYYFLFFPIGWAIGTLPINIGVVEGGLVYLFTRIPGVSFQQALVLAVCQRVIGFIGSIPGIFVHLSGLHLPPDISVEQEFFVDESLKK